MTDRVMFKHGTSGGYSNYKCRCELCREAWNRLCQKRKASSVGAELPESLEHGTDSSYQRGCRCEVCKAGHATDKRERRRALASIDLEQMKRDQDMSCAICRKPCSKFHVDHEHGTYRVRGLLCPTCNTGLGKLGDSIEGLERALAYLRG